MYLSAKCLTKTTDMARQKYMNKKQRKEFFKMLAEEREKAMTDKEYINDPNRTSSNGFYKNWTRSATTRGFSKVNGKPKSI